MLTLRPYQLDLVERARQSMRAGQRRILLQGPTGMGKTALTAHMLASAAAKGKRSWFCVHRRELVEQSVETFVVAADLHVGIVAAGYPSDISAPVQVCSVASLARRMGSLPAPDLVVWDECQHLASKSWTDIAAALPNAVHVGLTATPQRLDGKGLRPYFDELLLGPTTAGLIEQGFLSRYQLYAPAMLDTSQLHTFAGDYSKREVADTMTASTVVGDAVSTYLRHMRGGEAVDAIESHAGTVDNSLALTGAAHPTNTPTGGRALVFAWSLDASRGLAAAFVAAGIPAVHLDGETPQSERRAAIRAFRDGSGARVITSVDLFAEGLDIPALDAVFQLRPTSSLSLYLQQVGRGLRTAEGKNHVKIFDHVGNWSRHGLPDDPRQWSLDGVTKRRTSEAVQYGKRCPKCFAVSSIGAKACVICGAIYPVKQRTMEHVEGELSAIDPATIRERLRDEERDCTTLADWHALAKRRGHKAGWAFYRFTAARLHGHDVRT